MNQLNLKIPFLIPFLAIDVRASACRYITRYSKYAMDNRLSNSIFAITSIMPVLVLMLRKLTRVLRRNMSLVDSGKLWGEAG